MHRRWTLTLAAALVALGWLAVATAPAHAQGSGGLGTRFWHYPYYFFPHNYWPQMGPPYREPVGQPYMRPPAYMAYPAFHEPLWRYEFWEPQHYYRGFHFWLDQF